jgi:transposase
MEEIIARKYQVLQSEWNERQKRLWAASEAIEMGRGGISIVARATGLSRPTIYKWINELQNNERLPDHRIRRVGGGRKKSTHTQPTLLHALDALVEPTAKGDPMSPLRWTTKSTRRLCKTLQEQGFKVSPVQVCRLLHELDYQLSANRKSLEGGKKS